MTIFIMILLIIIVSLTMTIIAMISTMTFTTIMLQRSGWKGYQARRMSEAGGCLRNEEGLGRYNQLTITGEDLGLRVQGSGFRAQGSGFRVQGSGGLGRYLPINWRSLHYLAHPSIMLR